MVSVFGASQGGESSYVYVGMQNRVSKTDERVDEMELYLE